MRFIDLDAGKWKTTLDFYDALLAAIGAPKGHGLSPAALIDSMVWGGMNSLEPPYTIRISGTAGLPKGVRDDIEEASQLLGKGRKYYQNSRGGDVEVAIETVS
jgi:hypothetical protein